MSSPATSPSSSCASTASAKSQSPKPVDPLFSDMHCQRLLKLRHQNIDKMEIKTDVMSAMVNYAVTRFTVYKLGIQSSVRLGQAGDWLLEKRYSEFSSFRRDMLQLLRDWETALGSASKPSDVPQPLPQEFALASSALLPPLTAKFPRKHMRCDTKAIVCQRREGLTDFVRNLLAAYANISVYVANNAAESPEYTTLKALFVQLEDFLCVPDAQKDEDRRQADAILALDDVDDAEDTCCICLDDSCPTHDPAAESLAPVCGEKMVQLPCRHQFHEDCIIDWFNASTTCPLCRCPAFKESPRVFDVTMREFTEL